MGLNNFTGAGTIRSDTGISAFPGATAAAEPPVPSLIYAVEFKEGDELCVDFYTSVESIPEEYDGCTVYVYGSPTKHTFIVGKRITA